MLNKILLNLVVFGLILAPFSATAETALLIIDIKSTVRNNTIIIEWRTNKPVQGRVDFGLDANYGQSLDNGLGLRSDHRIVIGNLEARKTYHFRVSAIGADGTLVRSFDRTAKTGKAKKSDYDAPEIYDMNLIYYSDREAFLVWRTDEKANGVVRFGVGNRLDKRATHSGLRTYHLVKLAGLKRDTYYGYIISSKDAQGNLTESQFIYFKTLNHSGTRGDALEVQNFRPLSASDPQIQQRSAIITWRTNRPATGHFYYRKTNSSKWHRQETYEYSYEHEFFLNDLDPGTEYTYKLGSRDVFGKPVGFTHTFETPPDVKVAGARVFLDSDESYLPVPSDVTPIVALYRAEKSSRVYAVMNNQKHWLRNPSVFESYGLRWSDVQVVSADFLDSYSDAHLIRVSGSGEMYYIYNRFGTKKLLRNDAVFGSYPRNSRNNLITILAVDALSISDQRVVKLADRPEVYLLTGDAKQVFANEHAFFSRGYRWQDIAIVSSADLNSYVTGEMIN